MTIPFPQHPVPVSNPGFHHSFDAGVAAPADVISLYSKLREVSVNAHNIISRPEQTYLVKNSA